HAVGLRGSRFPLLHCREGPLGDAVARLLHLGLEGRIHASIFRGRLHRRPPGDIVRASSRRRKYEWEAWPPGAAPGLRPAPNWRIGGELGIGEKKGGEQREHSSIQDISREKKATRLISQPKYPEISCVPSIFSRARSGVGGLPPQAGTTDSSCRPCRQ